VESSGHFEPVQYVRYRSGTMLPSGLKKRNGFVWVFALDDYAHGEGFFTRPTPKLRRPMENSIGASLIVHIMQQLLVVSTRQPNSYFHPCETFSIE
jgi:hypothetical protein